MPLVSFTRQRHFTFGPNRSLPDGTRAVAFSGKRDPSSQHRPLPAPTARCPPLAGKRIWMFPGRPRFIQKAEPRFYRLRASEFPRPCHALCGFAGAGRARRSRCATESVKRGELSCHPEPAERGEGPHNCNPRVRFKEKAQIALERSLFVLRRIGMTTREGSASGSRGCLPGDRKGMTRSKRANGGGRRREYT